MEKEKKEKGLISFIRLILTRRKTIIRNTLIGGILAAAMIFCIPRTYYCKVTLAPEYDSGSSMGSLASMAASFGINLGNSLGSDAISPMLYPDVVASKEFLVTMFDVKVKTNDGKLETDYYTYLRKHQKSPWWDKLSYKISKFFKNLFSGEESQPSQGKKIDPFRLSENEYKMTERMAKLIVCEVDNMSSIITIGVTDQDPLICATIADSVKVHLQDFIIQYRTSKARNDMEYYQKLLDKAKYEYDKAVNAYTKYTDSHRELIMQSYISERDKLESAMQMKFGVYTALTQQLEAAKAKVQEATPAFTTLQCASVPIKPNAPSRVTFILLIMFLTFAGTAFCIGYSETLHSLWDSAKKRKKKIKEEEEQVSEPTTDENIQE